VIDPKQARTSRGDLDNSVRANSGGTVQAGSDRVPAVHWHMASTRSLPVPQAFRPVEPVEPIETRSPSRRTLWGLDGLNFLLADVQTGVGPFLAIYLAGYTWNEERVGLALTAGGIAGILTQTPAGGLVDFLRSKRALVGVAVAALAGGAFLIALFPSFWPVMGAQILIGGTSSVFIPAICAMSLGIVGRTAFDARQGRNQTFNSAGNVVAALSMGLLGYLDSNRSIFFFVVALALPTILVLLLIQPAEIDYELARGANEGEQGGKAESVWALFHDRPLVIFLVCAVMFHFANAAMLPLLGEMLAKGRGRSSMLFMSACVVTTQFVITLIASWSGRKAGAWGRKPLLLVAFAALPIRGVLYTFTANTAGLVAIQVLDGVGAGIFGVVSVLVIADLTRGTGRFNLTLGAITMAVGIGAALSQVIAGSIAYHLGSRAGFLFLAGVASAALGIVYLFMPETREKRTLDPTP
jgi:predicted MFS family arabinose efflux permease